MGPCMILPCSIVSGSPVTRLYAFASATPSGVYAKLRFPTLGITSSHVPAADAYPSSPCSSSASHTADTCTSPSLPPPPLLPFALLRPSPHQSPPPSRRS